MSEGRAGDGVVGADAVGELAVGGQVPNFGLLDHAGNQRRLSELVLGDPTVLHFYRGWWCPKELNDPYVPVVAVIGPDFRVHSVHNGHWYWGRPTLDELVKDLREITRALRPDWEAPTP